MKKENPWDMDLYCMIKKKEPKKPLLNVTIKNGEEKNYLYVNFKRTDQNKLLNIITSMSETFPNPGQKMTSRNIFQNMAKLVL